jgi:hypothetical protein
VGPGINLQGTVPTSADLPPTSIVGYAYQALDTGDLWVYTSSGWIDAGPIRGPEGPAGPQGIQGNPGVDGVDGDPATVTVGTTTTGAAGSNASVVNVGTTQDAVLNFTIPRGTPGTPGQGIPTGGTTGQVLTKSGSSDYQTVWSNLDPSNLSGKTTSFTTSLGTFTATAYGVYIGHLAGNNNNSGSGAGYLDNVVIGNNAGRSMYGGAQNNTIIGRAAGYQLNNGSNNILIGPECGISLTAEENQFIFGSHLGRVGYNNLTILGNNSWFLAIDNTSGGVSFSDWNTGVPGQTLRIPDIGGAPKWSNTPYLFTDRTINSGFDTSVYGRAISWDTNDTYTNTPSIVPDSDPSYASELFNLQAGLTYKVTVNLGAYQFSNSDGYCVFMVGFRDRVSGSVVPATSCSKMILFGNNRNNGETLVPSLSVVFRMPPVPDYRNNNFGVFLTEGSGSFTLRGGYCNLLIEVL